eukprot:12413396-Karenia_brevis.AAC.1
MLAQAKVEDMPALLQFASTVQELATISEWPAEVAAEVTLPTLGLTAEEEEDAIENSGNVL